MEKFDLIVIGAYITYETFVGNENDEKSGH